MNFVDIFKSSFLEGYSGAALSAKAVIGIVVITAMISAYIFITYRLVNKKSFYNKSFHASLPALAIITAAIILTIQSNIVVSLIAVRKRTIDNAPTIPKDTTILD